VVFRTIASGEMAAALVLNFRKIICLYNRWSYLTIFMSYDVVSRKSFGCFLHIASYLKVKSKNTLKGRV